MTEKDLLNGKLDGYINTGVKNINKEILSQLARQQDLPNHECKVSVKTISDESFEQSYGDKRASIVIIMPHSKRKEVREKYRV